MLSYRKFGPYIKGEYAMKCLIVAVILSLFSLFSVGSVFASNREKGDVEVNLWIGSRHIENAPLGKKFNESNPGIGVRKYLTERSGFEIFADGNYINKNSTGGRLIMGGVGAQRPIFSYDKVDVLLGGIAGAMVYENRWERKKYLSPGAYVFVETRHEDISFTLGYVPTVTLSNGTGSYATLFGYVSVRF